jgi:hypothetical protein
MESAKPAWWRGSFRPKPVAGWEVAAMRVLFILLVNWKIPSDLPFSSQPKPTGLAHWIDFSMLGNESVLGGVRLAIALLSIPYVLGMGLWFVIPAITFLHIAIFTFFNSQGFVSHAWQIISMILVAQSAVVLFFAGWRVLAKKPFAFPAGLSPHSYWLYFSQGVLVVGYMTSAVSKLLRSDGAWLWNTRNIPIALLRTRMQLYYSNPEIGPPPGEPPLATWLINHPAAAILLFGPGLFLELFAFMGLWNRTFSFWTGIALIVMHRLIATIMQLSFELNEWALLIFFVNIPWWCCRAWRRVND